MSLSRLSPMPASASERVSGAMLGGREVGSAAAGRPGVAPDWAPTGRTAALLVGSGLAVVGQMYVVLPLSAAMGATMGVPAERAAVTATAFGLAYALGLLVAGPLSDRYGARAMVVAGLAITAFTTASVALGTTIGGVTAIRVVQGFFAALFVPAAVSYVVQSIRPQRRAFVLSCVTSSLFAAAIVSQVLAQILAPALGWRGVFVAFAALMLAAALTAAATLRPGGGQRGGSITGAFAAIPRLLAAPQLLGLFAAAAALLGGFVSIYTTLALAAPPALAGSSGAQLLLRLAGLPAMVAVPFLAPALSRMPARRRVAGGLFLASAAALAASFVAGDAAALAPVLLAFIAALVAAAPALIEAIAEGAGQSRGAATALYAFSMFLGGSIGGHLVSLSTGFGFGAIVRVMAAVLAVGGALGLASRRPGRA